MVDFELFKLRAKSLTCFNAWIYGSNLLVDRQNRVFLDSHVVDKNSICRFTGLQDANGTDIYENDRLKFDGHSHFVVFDSAEIKNITKNILISNPVVCWEKDMSAFMLAFEYMFSYPLTSIDGNCYFPFGYKKDAVHSWRFASLTPDFAKKFIVSGNAIDSPDDGFLSKTTSEVISF